MAPSQNDPSSLPSGRRKVNNDNNGRGNLSEEFAIYRTFMLVIQNKFTDTPSSPSHEGGGGGGDSDSAQRTMDRLDKLYSSSEYNAEKKLISDISTNGIPEAICFGLGTFVFLRSGPRLMTRFLNRKFKNNGSSSGNSGNVGGGYQFDIRNATSAGSSQSGPTIDPAIPRPGLFLRTLKFGLDTVVSLFAAAYGSFHFVDRKKLMGDVADIPLVSGRSVISDELCSDFIDVYRAIPKKIWDKYDGKSEDLDAITSFVKNCLRRQQLEKEIIQDRQSFGSFGFDGDSNEAGDDDGHVSIPSPGVSKDIQVEIPWIDKSEDIKVGRDPSMPFGEDESFESGYDYGWDGEDSNDNDKEWR